MEVQTEAQAAAQVRAEVCAEARTEVWVKARRVGANEVVAVCNSTEPQQQAVVHQVRARRADDYEQVPELVEAERPLP